MSMRPRLLLVVAAGLAALFVLGPAGGQAPRNPYKLTPIGKFDGPVQLTAPPGDTRRVFVVEKPGRIRVVVNGKVQQRPFLDIASLVDSAGGEMGLLSMAFAPGYAKNGLFYVYYTDKESYARLVEYKRASAGRADLKSARQLLRIGPPAGEHYAGQLQFGPKGKLHLSVGDGGLNRFRDPMRAQRLNDVHGKIISVNRRTKATRVVARGLRNPWRFWFDRVSGDLYVGDPGEFVRESIDYAPAEKLPGANFGWPCFEGTLPKPDYPAASCPRSLPPIYEWARQFGNCAAIGGLVVRDPRLPSLRGRYLFADFCLGEILSTNVKWKDRTPRALGFARRPSLSSFGEDARRRVYVVTLNGPVYRLDPR